MSTLSTLPDRELASGISEVVKYGLIRDAPFFEWLEANAGALLARDAEAMAYAIERSCINKAEVVAADEKENDLRATLNLGHTFGHAIETGEWASICRFVHSFICLFVRSFVRSFVRLFVRSFVRSFVCFYRMGIPDRASWPSSPPTLSCSDGLRRVVAWRGRVGWDDHGGVDVEGAWMDRGLHLRPHVAATREGAFLAGYTNVYTLNLYYI